jgi:hypothetical protein
MKNVAGKHASLFGKKGEWFNCGDLPQWSVTSGRAATGGSTGFAPRFPAGKGGQHFAGLSGFAGRTDDL